MYIAVCCYHSKLILKKENEKQISIASFQRFKLTRFNIIERNATTQFKNCIDGTFISTGTVTVVGCCPKFDLNKQFRL